MRGEGSFFEEEEEPEQPYVHPLARIKDHEPNPTVVTFITELSMLSDGFSELWSKCC